MKEDGEPSEHIEGVVVWIDYVNLLYLQWQVSFCDCSFNMSKCVYSKPKPTSAKYAFISSVYLKSSLSVISDVGVFLFESMFSSQKNASWIRKQKESKHDYFFFEAKNEPNDGQSFQHDY